MNQQSERRYCRLAKSLLWGRYEYHNLCALFRDMAMTLEAVVHIEIIYALVFVVCPSPVIRVVMIS
jgi:hypothetical protein